MAFAEAAAPVRAHCATFDLPIRWRNMAVLSGAGDRFCERRRECVSGLFEGGVQSCRSPSQIFAGHRRSALTAGAAYDRGLIGGTLGSLVALVPSARSTSADDFPASDFRFAGFAAGIDGNSSLRNYRQARDDGAAWKILARWYQCDRYPAFRGRYHKWIIVVFAILTRLT